MEKKEIEEIINEVMGIVYEEIERLIYQEGRIEFDREGVANIAIIMDINAKIKRIKQSFDLDEEVK